MLAGEIREKNEESGRSRASGLREEHGLGYGPIADLPSFIEEAVELDVRITDMPEGVDALTVEAGDQGRILIGVATTENAERQRFSLAHELGHALFNDLLTASESEDPIPATEDRAHCFARHFLIPEAGIKHRLHEMGAQDHPLQRHHLSALVQHFGVSATVVARQLHRMGLIDESRLHEWSNINASQLAIEFGWDAERASRVQKAKSKRLPQRIAARAVHAYSTGSLTLERLSQIRRDDSLQETKVWVEKSGLTVTVTTSPQPSVQIDEL